MNTIKNSYGFIYVTTNITNGRKYIGQKKVDKEGRWKTYLGSGTAFLKAVTKYGKENFKREILAIGHSSEELNKLEHHYISKYNAVGDRTFYNIVEGGGTVTGLKHSEETKELLRKRFSGEGNYFHGKCFKGEDNAFYGKKHTDESRMKMSKSHKGQVSWCKGKVDIFSKEALHKMSIAKKGIPLTEEHKRNIRNSQSGVNHPMYGKHHSEESKAKISIANKGKTSPRKGATLTDETKKKLSKAHKGKGVRRVRCITTGKCFNSITEASEYYNCNKSCISQCCKGTRATAGKLDDNTRLKWEYQN